MKTYRQLLDEDQKERLAQEKIDRLAKNMEKFLFGGGDKELKTLDDIAQTLHRVEALLVAISKQQAEGWHR